MAHTDGESDSPNPSKSFNVGAADRLSGFFTPVWESKRRRAEGERPSSRAPSKPASVPAKKSEPPRANGPLPAGLARQLTPAGGTPVISDATSSPGEAKLETQAGAELAPAGAVSQEPDASRAANPAGVSPAAAAPAAEELATAAAPPTLLGAVGAAALPAEPKAAPATIESPIATHEKAVNEKAAHEKAAHEKAAHEKAAHEKAAHEKAATDRGTNVVAKRAATPARAARAPSPEAGAAPAARGARWRNDSPVPEARRIVAVASREALAASSASAASSDFGVPQAAPGSEADWDSPDTLPKPFASGESATPEARLSHLLRRLRRTMPLYTALPERVRKLVEEDPDR